MYTRNPGSGRLREQKSSPYANTAFGGKQQDSSMPLLIPQDYRGEFLREHRSAGIATPQTDAAQHRPTDVLPTEDALPTAVGEAEPVTSDAFIGEAEAPAPPEQMQNRGGTLLGGLYDLFIGENSSEEETVLLLAIGLLILWGHLDRGGLFDRSSWEDDGLALLLIGYLLLS